MQMTENKLQKQTNLHSIEEAIEDIKNGKIIIVVDDENRENEGDFVLAAEKITPEMVNFMITHGRGLVCVPLIESRCKKLELDLMVGKNTDSHKTAFTVSVDKLGDGCTTGISASDRAKTIKALVDIHTKPEDLSRPGHIFPLKAKQGGVLRRTGHTEAAIDLARLAGLAPAGVIVEIMNEDGTMARLPQLRKIAKKFDLKIVSIENLVAYRMQHDSLIIQKDNFQIQTKYGKLNMYVFEQTTNDQIHVAFTKGNWNTNNEIPIKVYSKDTQYILDALFNEEVVEIKELFEYLNTQEYFCVICVHPEIDKNMLHSKIELLKKGENIFKGKDNKDFGIGAQIIHHLGISKLKLLTKHPVKRIGITGYNLEIVDNIDYTYDKNI